MSFGSFLLLHIHSLYNMTKSGPKSGQEVAQKAARKRPKSGRKSGPKNGPMVLNFYPLFQCQFIIRWQKIKDKGKMSEYNINVLQDFHEMSLKRHIKDVHFRNQNTYVICPQCCKQYASQVRKPTVLSQKNWTKLK